MALPPSVSALLVASESSRYRPYRGYELELDDRLRIYVVSVKGVSVAIMIEAPSADFATFAADAEAVVATYKWVAS